MAPSPSDSLHDHLIESIKSFCTDHLLCSGFLQVEGTVCIVDDQKNVIIASLKSTCSRKDLDTTKDAAFQGMLN